MSWWCGWVEERVGLPDLVDVVDTERIVFEQVRGLSIDLEGVCIVQLIEIEQLTHITECNTNGYERRDINSRLPECGAEAEGAGNYVRPVFSTDLDSRYGP